MIVFQIKFLANINAVLNKKFQKIIYIVLVKLRTQMYVGKE